MPPRSEEPRVQGGLEALYLVVVTMRRYDLGDRTWYPQQQLLYPKNVRVTRDYGRTKKNSYWYVIKIFSRTSAVSSTNFGSILIFASCLLFTFFVTTTFFFSSGSSVEFGFLRL